MGTLSSLRMALVGLLVALGPPALAQDDDDFDDLDEEEGGEEEPAPKPPADDAPPGDEDPGDDEWNVPNTQGEELDLEDDDLFEEDSQVGTRGEGEDTAAIYREALEEYSRLGPDEEALAWERYLRKYPNSIFKTRVQERLDELNQELYEGEIRSATDRNKDAGRSELNFAQPLQLENIDPRSKIRGGFEWGIPGYLNLITDLEYALFRELSVHGGIRRRFTGWNVEAGGKYALIKSARTRTLVTVIGDARLNLNPTFPALRPALGFGQSIMLAGDSRIDLNLQAGSDLALIENRSGDLVFDPRLVGGLNVTIIPSQTVRVFFETSSYMKNFGDEEVGVFRFNQISIGMRFVQRRSKTEDKFEAGGGASVPYTSKYWGYHDGSVAGDIHWFL